ncbi:MAG: 3-hydroxyacyl-CoA dehydrogenase family protein [Chitinophagaceae bacterium]
MKVLVLATDEQKEELLAFPIHGDLNLIWGVAMNLEKDLLPVEACIDLLFENNTERIEWLRQLQSPLVIVNAVIHTLEEIGDDFIRINGWNSFLKRPITEAASRHKSLKEKAETLFSYFGRRVEWTPDIPGFITARVVVSIINEAFLALEENVTVAKEIDIAMKLGTNYPYGPFEWGEKIGLTKVVSLLNTLTREQTRYKPSQLLKEKILV